MTPASDAEQLLCVSAGCKTPVVEGHYFLCREHLAELGRTPIQPVDSGERVGDERLKFLAALYRQEGYGADDYSFAAICDELLVARAEIATLRRGYEEARRQRIDAEQENATLRASLGKAEADAGRYRWLREEDWLFHAMEHSVDEDFEYGATDADSIDNAIDAALAAVTKDV